ncbi:unnamed protein product [Effrenium voratum]|nr:unnamed protein product [Effrenium voratum]
MSLDSELGEGTVEALGEAMRGERDRLGTDVHPELGVHWLRYGSALLRHVEGMTGQEMETAPALGTADVSAGSTYEEMEEDLEVAWETLEMARRCCEIQGDALLARCHLRLADLLLLQALLSDRLLRGAQILGAGGVQAGSEPLQVRRRSGHCVIAPTRNRIIGRGFHPSRSEWKRGPGIASSGSGSEKAAECRRVKEHARCAQGLCVPFCLPMLL